MRLTVGTCILGDARIEETEASVESIEEEDNCYAPEGLRAVGIESTRGEIETDSAAVMKFERRVSRERREVKWDGRGGKELTQRAEENRWNLPPLYAEILWSVR